MFYGILYCIIIYLLIFDFIVKRIQLVAFKKNNYSNAVSNIWNRYLSDAQNLNKTKLCSQTLSGIIRQNPPKTFLSMHSL